VEATGWENVASRIPSGRVFRVRQLVEGSAAKVVRVAARLTYSKLALLVIPAAVVTGYVAYKVLPSNPTPVAVQRMNVAEPASIAPSNELPVNVDPSDTPKDIPVGNKADLSRSVLAPQPTASSTTSGGMGSPASVVNVARGGASNAFAHQASGMLTDAVSKGSNIASEGGAKSSASADISVVSNDRFATPQTAAGKAAGRKAATSNLRSGGGSSGNAFAARNVSPSNGTSNTPFRTTAIRNREPLGSRSVGSAQNRSTLTHRSLHSATNSNPLAVVRPNVLDQPNKQRGINEREKAMPMSRIAIQSSDLRLQSGHPTNGPIRFDAVPLGRFNLRRFSSFWGAALEVGAARSDSSTFALAGVNAFTGVMYRGRVGLLVTAGARWVGSYYTLACYDLSKKVDIPGTNPDSAYAKTTSTSIKGYMQASFGADAVVRLYANPTMSLYATAGMRGCWVTHATGDSTSRTFLPLSAVRFSTAYQRNVWFGSLLIGAAVEYQLKQARPLSKSDMLFGVSIGIVF